MYGLMMQDECVLVVLVEVVLCLLPCLPEFYQHFAFMIHTYIHTYTRYDLSLCLWSLLSQQYAGASSALTLSLRGNSASALQQLFLPPRGASPSNHSELGQGTTIVAHCITPTGRSSAKMLFLQQVGLWNDSAITLHIYAEDIPQIQ